MQSKPSFKWIIAAVLFGGFLLSLWLDLTGLAIHQWLGVAVGALAAYHLIVHRQWVVAVTQRLFGRTSGQARLFYLVDACLAAGLAAIIVTGLAISTWLNLALASYAAWRVIHVTVSIMTLILVVTKIGLHWRWIVSTARKMVSSTPAPANRAKTPQPVTAAAANSLGRREFLRLMAGVGAVALLTGAHALGNLSGSQVEASSAPATSTQTQATQAATGSGSGSGAGSVNSSSPAASSSTCTVRCPRGCSYPGHCGRYTDSNGNGRCDFGECLS